MCVLCLCVSKGSVAAVVQGGHSPFPYLSCVGKEGFFHSVVVLCSWSLIVWLLFYFFFSLARSGQDELVGWRKISEPIPSLFGL